MIHMALTCMWPTHMLLALFKLGIIGCQGNWVLCINWKHDCGYFQLPPDYMSLVRLVLVDSGQSVFRIILIISSPFMSQQSMAIIFSLQQAGIPLVLNLLEEPGLFPSVIPQRAKALLIKHNILHWKCFSFSNKSIVNVES